MAFFLHLVRTFFPSVIEPSFGIGRITYALFEHSFGVREGTDNKGWMAFPPIVAPVKCCVVPLLTNQPAKFGPILHRIGDDLRRINIPNRIDDSSTSLGKKYVRFDEVGVPFAVTVDVRSTDEADAGEPVTVTLRDRDSMQQIRLPASELPAVVASLSSQQASWASVVDKYGLLAVAEDVEGKVYAP